MTMAMSDPIPGQPKPPEQQQQPRPRLHSLTAMPTHLITLSPAFLEALRKVAPKGRRSKLPYVVGLLLVAAIVVGAVPAARQRVIALAQGVLHRTPAAVAAPASADPGTSAVPPVETATASVPAAPSAVVAPVVVVPQQIVTSSATSAASAPSAKAAKPPKAPKLPWKTYRRAPR